MTGSNRAEQLFVVKNEARQTEEFNAARREIQKRIRIERAREHARAAERRIQEQAQPASITVRPLSQAGVAPLREAESGGSNTVGDASITATRTAATNAQSPESSNASVQTPSQPSAEQPSRPQYTESFSFNDEVPGHMVYQPDQRPPEVRERQEAHDLDREGATRWSVDGPAEQQQKNENEHKEYQERKAAANLEWRDGNSLTLDDASGDDQKAVDSTGETTATPAAPTTTDDTPPSSSSAPPKPKIIIHPATAITINTTAAEALRQPPPHLRSQKPTTSRTAPSLSSPTRGLGQRLSSAQTPLPATQATLQTAAQAQVQSPTRGRQQDVTPDWVKQARTARFFKKEAGRGRELGESPSPERTHDSEEDGFMNEG